MDVAISIAQKLLPILEPLQDKIKDWHCRVVPSTANSADSAFRALPLAREWRWHTCEEHLKRFNADTLILQLPSFWQVEPFVYAAAHNAKTPMCIIEPQNYPLDKASIKLASANAVLAEATEAAAIAEYLHAGQIELPPYWMLVHAADATSWRTPHLLQNRQLEVAEEVHLAPGVPLLVQCGHSMTAQNNLFHRSSLFEWNSDLAAPAISTSEKMPMLFSLTNFALPFQLKDRGVCACGQTLLERI